MSTLKVWFAESPLRSRLQMLPVHKYLGASALVLTVMAVNTGIMDKLPWGSCNYQLDEGVQYRKDYDPAGEVLILVYECLLIRSLTTLHVLQRTIHTSLTPARLPTVWASA